MTTQELINSIVKVLDDKKASDIVVLDIKELTVLAEHFIIASANSTTQVKALAGTVEKELKDKGVPLLHSEQKERGSKWILLDYGSIIVHLFYAETREFYDLERLWEDAPRREIDEIL